MSKLLKILTALVLLAYGGLGAGCGPGESAGLGAETDDSGYREGQQLVKQGRPQEALSAFLKVILQRGEAAPESHLQVGLILKEHLKDPIGAIHYFRKYLEQQPNSRLAPLVRQQIEAAKREFGRTLPNQPLDNPEVRMDGFDQRDRLERENEQLKVENSVLRSGGTGSASVPAPRSATTDTRDGQLKAMEEEASPITLAPIQQPEFEQMPKIQPTQPNAGVGVRAKPTSPSRVAGRRHTVAPKDSLYAIAKKYYGYANNANVQALIQANQDILSADNALKPGMELKIP